MYLSNQREMQTVLGGLGGVMLRAGYKPRKTKSKYAKPSKAVLSSHCSKKVHSFCCKLDCGCGCHGVQV